MENARQRSGNASRGRQPRDAHADHQTRQPVRWDRRNEPLALPGTARVERRSSVTAAGLMWVVTCAAYVHCLGGCSRGDSAAAARAKLPPNAPNIVLICIDTLRPDHLKCYGYARNTSPRIDQFAAEGTLFEHCISSTSWTLPAHCALFTGLLDSVHGCVGMNLPLSDSRLTMAEHLKSLGYATVGFFAAPALHPVFGVAQGFDEYVDCTSYTALMKDTLASGRSLDTWEMRERSHGDIANPRAYAAAHGWLQQHRDRPFFMFLHFWDVHADYIPPAPYDKMFDPDYQGPVTGRDFATDASINAEMPARDREHLVALYDGEIAWTDSYVGKFLDDLDAMGLREKTLVVLISDHGEEHFEHGGKGHRRTLYDEVIRIVLLARYPGHIPAGLRVREQVSIVDVLPTVLELAALPPVAPIMGQSVVPLLKGESPEREMPAISELFTEGREVRSARRLDRKLITVQGGFGLAFDLLADPHEQAPLVDPNSPVVRKLFQDMRMGRQWLDAFHSMIATTSGPAPELPEGVRKQLESLGYIERGHGDKGQDANTPP